MQGDVAVIGGRAFPKEVAEKRKRLVDRIEREGFEQVMEAMAYTWFNRFVAIRFMEVHGYLDQGYRVFSTTNSTPVEHPHVPSSGATPVEQKQEGFTGQAGQAEREPGSTGQADCTDGKENKAFHVAGSTADILKLFRQQGGKTNDSQN